MTKLWTRGILSILVLGTLILPGTALASEAPAEQAAGQTPQAAQAAPADLSWLEGEACSFTLDFDKVLNNWPGECPAGIPACHQDKQCDAYCGGTGFGDCGPNLCCQCAG